LAEAELEEKGGHTDGGYYDQARGLEKARAAGVDDDQSQGKEEQGRGEDGPAAWWGRGGRLEVASGKAFRCLWLYSAEAAFSMDGSRSI